MNVSMESNRARDLDRLLRERIVILDGAMGTMIQQRKLTEAEFRGERFKDWQGKDLKGNNDLLNLTQPQIDRGYPPRNTSKPARTSSRPTRSIPRPSRWRITGWNRSPMNWPGRRGRVRAARRGCQFMAAHPDRVCFVAGAIGPTTKTSSISTDVNNPAARGATFDELVIAYGEQVRGLLDGGVDLLLVETIFDTLNAKAAFFAILQVLDERGLAPLPCSAAVGKSQIPNRKSQIPLLASVTYIQAGSNRGCDRPDRRGVLEFDFPRAAVERRHELRARTEGTAPAHRGTFRASRRFTSAPIRTPACPIRCCRPGFPETPETLAPQLQEWARNGWLNIVGGCCGTTPAHIRAIAEAVRGMPPRERAGGRTVLCASAVWMR